LVRPNAHPQPCSGCEEKVTLLLLLAGSRSNSEDQLWRKRRKRAKADNGDQPSSGLTARAGNGILRTMSAQEIIEQIKALPANERAQVAKFVVENDDSWIPESFKEGMADAEAGRLVDLDTALNEPYAGEQ
jgi:predicted transcriptional regulator